ncbi:MAG: FdhF/YdeP family oxidoreductase [Spirosomataceae bacterium]
MPQLPNPQPPQDLTGLSVSPPPQNSVGWGALSSSLEQMATYMDAPDALKISLKVNQKGGFDCPGCAWPDPDDERSMLGEYCENGIKALAEEATNRRIGASFFKNHSVIELANWSDFELGKSGRLAEPLVLRIGATHYEPISWEEAFQLVATELNALPSPDEAVFYTSGRTSNEAAFLYQLFVREFGTNNLPDCSNMCHESSGSALSQTLGLGKGSVTLEDIHQADVVMVIGQNPGTNHPRMLSALEKCKERGGKIISVNPLPEAGLIRFTNPQRPLKMLTGGTPLTDLFLQVRINGDVPFLKALMLLLYQLDQEQGGVLDWSFIQEKTEGFDLFLEGLQSSNFQQLLQDCGLAEQELREAAQLLAKTQKIIVCWAMGLTQHKNAVDNIREIVNLLLMKGSIGRPGAGTCPVRGHSNVQGDRTMGIWEAPKPAFLEKLKTVFGFEPPQEHGFSVVDAIKAMHERKASVFFAMGGNFLSATPDTELTAEALRRCKLTVHVSTKLNRSHLIHGQQALILPCLGRTEKDIQGEEEQFVSVENSMGVVSSSKGVLEPCSEQLKSEVAIVCGLAEATLGAQSKVNWAAMKRNYDHIREAIEQVIPGFERYNERVRQPGGFYLPNGPREGKFLTPSGKALFTVNTYERFDVGPGELLMMTIRSHDQFNTTIYGLNDRYRGIHNERRVILMNQHDMDEQGLTAKQIVNLSSHYNGQTRLAETFLVVPYNIPRGCVATYFPEANVLVPLELQAHTSKTPASKSIVIRVEAKGMSVKVKV